MNKVYIVYYSLVIGGAKEEEYFTPYANLKKAQEHFNELVKEDRENSDSNWEIEDDEEEYDPKVSCNRYYESYLKGDVWNNHCTIILREEPVIE